MAARLVGLVLMMAGMSVALVELKVDPMVALRGSLWVVSMVVSTGSLWVASTVA
jgi:hypothetical protein